MEKLNIRKPNKDEEKRKAECLEQLAQDRRQLLLHWPFLGNIIMRMELIPVRDDRLGTASTDNEKVFVDIDFYSKLSQAERLFVLAHEVWHCVMLHFARRQTRDLERFNIAADLEIHFVLMDDKKMKEPFVLPHDPMWKGLSAEAIYERYPDFLKESQEKEAEEGKRVAGDAHRGGKSIGKDSDFGNGAKGFDKHIYQGDMLPDPETMGDGQGADQGAGQGKKRSKGRNNSRSDGEGTGHSSDFVVDSDYTPHVSKDAVEQSRARTIAAAQQVERTRGELPGEVKALLEQLQQPSIPWQEMLKQFVTSCYGGKRRWLPPSRRHVWQDIYLPSMRDESLRAVVALDTSGSTEGDLPVFFGELVSLMKSFGKFDLTVIQCDASIKNVEHYTDAQLPPPNKKWKVKGLGGTDFCPVFYYVDKEMSEKPDLLLYFTDGYGPAPVQRPAYPVMWVLTHDGEVPAEWGRVARFKRARQ